VTMVHLFLFSVYNFLITFKDKYVGTLIPILNNSLVFSLFDHFSKSRDTSNHASINTTSQGTSVTDNMTLMMTAFNTVSKCVSGLRDTVNNLMKEKIYDVNKQFSLQQWYSAKINS
jgi:hypothetical protein